MLLLAVIAYILFIGFYPISILWHFNLNPKDFIRLEGPKGMDYSRIELSYIEALMNPTKVFRWVNDLFTH